MAVSETAFEVLIIGAGPVGLATALQLGRAGVRTLILERRATFSRHSKAAGVHARTMEIYRQWGISERIRNEGSGGGGVFTAGWMTRMAGLDKELGSITMGEAPAERELLMSWSPEMMCLCGQDTYEPIMADVLRSYPCVELRLGAEALAISQDADGVSVEYAKDGGVETVRGQYAVGADGVRSPIRKAMGITEDALPSFGNSINVLFEAPLEEARAGRRYGLFWVANGETQGAISWKRRGDLWSYNFEAADGEDPESYTPERSVGLIRAAVGIPDLEVKVLSILHWQHDQSVTNTWRDGRVFLAGDASHRFPPHGGFGMNSGVQDSQNLAWKLIARLRWGAGDGLLDTYQDERLPVARRNGEQCLINTRRMAETGWLLKDPNALADIEKPVEGAKLRQGFIDAIPKQREQFFSQGQQFGQIYASAAVVDDGAPIIESTVSEYRPTGNPGARAPHIWLRDETGREYSSIDLYDGGFMLLTTTSGGAWVDAVTAVRAGSKAPLSIVQIGDRGHQQRAGDADWTKAFGLDGARGGAVLIRPDNHVAARWTAAPQDPAAALAAALSQVLAAPVSLAAATAAEAAPA